MELPALYGQIVHCALLPCVQFHCAYVICVLGACQLFSDACCWLLWQTVSTSVTTLWFLTKFRQPVDDASMPKEGSSSPVKAGGIWLCTKNRRMIMLCNCSCFWDPWFLLTLETSTYMWSSYAPGVCPDHNSQAWEPAPAPHLLGVHLLLVLVFLSQLPEPWCPIALAAAKKQTTFQDPRHRVQETGAELHPSSSAVDSWQQFLRWWQAIPGAETNWNADGDPQSRGMVGCIDSGWAQLLACGVSRADAAKWEDEWRCAWAEKGWHRTSTRTEGDHNLDKELAYLTSLLVLCSFSSPLRSGLDVGTSRLCPWNLKKRRAISRSLSLSLSHQTLNQRICPSSKWREEHNTKRRTTKSQTDYRRPTPNPNA